MNIRLFRLINRSIYIFLINWKKQIDKILYEFEIDKRIESNMRTAISKTINKIV